MDVTMLVGNDVRRDPRVLREARALVEAGWSVSVIGLTNGEDTEWEDHPAGFRVRRVRPEGAARAAVKKQLARLSPDAYAEITRRLRKMRGLPEKAPRASAVGVDPASPVSHAALRVAMATHPHRSLVMAQAAAVTAPQVVHAHDLDTLLAASWAARISGAALVYDAHEIWWQQHPEGAAPAEWIDYFRELESGLIDDADLVITVCDSIARFLADTHDVALPLVVRNSLDTPPGGFLDPGALHAPGDPVEVLFHGVLAAGRGLEALVEAASSFEGAVLVVRGFGDLEPVLRELAAKGRAGAVRFEAPVPMADVVRAASASDIGVIPYQPVSLNNRFSTPNKLFEYLGAGLAVIASDLPEIRRIVEAEQVGRVFDPIAPGPIAEAVNALARDREGLAAMRRRAASSARERHHWGVDKQVLVAAYRALLPRPLSERLRRLAGGRPRR